MEKASTLTALAGLQADLKALGAANLYLFGSTAREEAREDSDVDLFFDVADPERFSLLDLVGIKNFLEGKLGVEVDVTTRSSLHPMLKDRIEASAIRVF